MSRAAVAARPLPSIRDIMMEHSMFFVQLMPAPEFEGQRRQAEEFQPLFARGGMAGAVAW